MDPSRDPLPGESNDTYRQRLINQMAVLAGRLNSLGPAVRTGTETGAVDENVPPGTDADSAVLLKPSVSGNLNLKVQSPINGNIGSSGAPYYFSTQDSSTDNLTEHVHKKQKTIMEFYLEIISQDQANDMVLNNVLQVSDVNMNLIVSDNVLSKIALQLSPQHATIVKGKPACLLYGHPGAGKTRLFRELVQVINSGGGSEFYERINKQFCSGTIKLSEVTVVAVTLNTTTYSCVLQDAELCNVRVDLPVALRIFYTYFKHGYPKNKTGFNQLCIDLLKRCTAEGSGDFLKYFTVQKMLSKILEGNSAKKHLLLLIDETLSLRTRVMQLNNQNDQKFDDFLNYMNSLQDATSGNLKGDLTCFSVIYSGLLDGPWVKDASASGRPLHKYLLTPLLPTSDAFNLIVHENGIELLSQHYTLIKPTPSNSVNDTLAQYFFYCSAGLPRAVEILRSILHVNIVTNVVRDYLIQSARMLQLYYSSVADDETLYLALLGRIIDGNPTENKDYVIRLHTYMSEGKCMLLPGKEPSGRIAEGCVVVNIPPMRLLCGEYSDNKHLSHIIVLLSEMTEKIFELFLVRHEMLMRTVRKYMNSKNLCPMFKFPYSKVDFSSTTLQELYFGAVNENDIEVEWRDESVRKARFNFTAPLQLFFMKDDQAIPNYNKADEFANTIVIPKDSNQKGFEYAIILRTQDAIPRMIAVLVQAKFTKIEAIQEVHEINETLEKCQEVIENHAKSLGWPLENVVLLFQTNRMDRNYRKMKKKQNLILMCNDSLEDYMGPTVWGMLHSCHCLANLQLGLQESRSVQPPAQSALPLTSTAALEHKEGCV